MLTGSFVSSFQIIVPVVLPVEKFVIVANGIKFKQNYF